MTTIAVLIVVLALTAALKAIAEGHGESAVRLRAADLLRARHAPKPTSK